MTHTQAYHNTKYPNHCNLKTKKNISAGDPGADPEGCGEVGGIVRHSGDKWAADDGCNTCGCFGTTPSCTEKFCGKQIGLKLGLNIP